MKVVTIIADDRVGLLMDISSLLAKAKINIESVNADAHAGKAVITMALSDAAKGRRILEDAGYKAEASGSIVVELADRPGELGRITAMLSKEGINIENVHTIAKDGKRTMLSLRTSDPKKAAALLKEYLVTAEPKE
jgi:hypothetical protein